MVEPKGHEENTRNGHAESVPLLVGMRDARAFTSLSHGFRDPMDHCYMSAHGTIAN